MRGGRGRPAGGYSLVELTMATAAAVVVASGVYAIFASHRRSAEAQRIASQLRSGGGFALEQMKAALLLAGYLARNPAAPVSGAGSDTVQLHETVEANGATRRGHLLRRRRTSFS